MVTFPTGLSFGQKDTKVDSLKTKLKKASVDTMRTKDQHPQDSPENTGFFIESKDGKSKLRIYGSVRLFGSNDFGGLSGGTGFTLSEIPTGTSAKSENTFFLTANISRVGLEAARKLFLGDVLVKVESDFNGNGSQFRIRHAYGQSKYLIIGQTWTGFSDIETLPATVDLDGPPTAVSLRTVQIKYFLDFKPGWRFRASLEVPGSEVNIPDSVAVEPVSQQYPALTGNIKKNWKEFEIKFAGIINPISVRNISGERASLLGLGSLVSAKVKFGSSTSLMLQGLIGRGIASFLNVSDNAAFDVILNPLDGKYQLTSTAGGFVAVSQKIAKNLIDIDLVYGIVQFKMQEYFAGSTFRIGQYVAVNGFLKAAAGFRLGLEYTYGYKRTKDDQHGTANRLSFTFYYDF